MINAHWLSSGKQSVKVFSRFSVWKKQSRQSTEFSISAQKWVTTNIKRSKMKNGVGYSCKKVKGGLYSQWPKGSGVTSHHFFMSYEDYYPPLFCLGIPRVVVGQKWPSIMFALMWNAIVKFLFWAVILMGFKDIIYLVIKKYFSWKKILLNTRQNWSK